MGAVTLTIPYIMSLNGYVLGSTLVFLGALLSYYSGMQLVKYINLKLSRLDVQKSQER